VIQKKPGKPRIGDACMQPNARPVEARRVFSLIQAPMLSRAVDESMGVRFSRRRRFLIECIYSENNGG
jgi:hypothetical protein